MTRLGKRTRTDVIHESSILKSDDEFSGVHSEEGLMLWLTQASKLLHVDLDLEANAAALSELKAAVRGRSRKRRTMSSTLKASAREFESITTSTRVHSEHDLQGVQVLLFQPDVWIIGGCPSGSTNTLRVFRLKALSLHDRVPIAPEEVAVPEEYVCGTQVSACVLRGKMLVRTTLPGDKKCVVYGLGIFSKDTTWKVIHRGWVPHGFFTGHVPGEAYNPHVLLFTPKGLVYTVGMDALDFLTISQVPQKLGGLTVEAVYLSPESTASQAFVHAAVRSPRGTPYVYTYKYTHSPAPLQVVSRICGLTMNPVTSLLCTRSSMYFTDVRGEAAAAHVSEGGFCVMHPAPGPDPAGATGFSSAIRLMSHPDYPCFEAVALYQYRAGVVTFTSIVPRFVREILKI